MSGRILFNDGEGLEFGDLNNIQAQCRRTLFDQVLWHLANPFEHPNLGAVPEDGWTPGTEYGSTIRPLRQAGMAYRVDATQMFVFGGLFIDTNNGPLDADDNTALVAASNNVALTGVAAAAAGLYRRDLIQARITLGSDPATSRDFKDAVTDALSTSSIVKRQDLSVEIQVKTNLTEGTLAAANDADNLPSPDSGWSVLGAFLVDDTGIVSGDENYWDYRKPWGPWRKVYCPLIDSHTDWNPTFDRYLTAGAVSAYIFTAFNLPHPTGVLASPSDLSNSMRIRRISLYSDFNSAPAAGSIDIYRENELTSRTNCEFVNYAGTAGQVGLRASTTAGLQVLYDQESYTKDGPLWLNGRSSGYTPVGAEHDNLGMGINAVDSADIVYKIIIDGWGAF